MCLMHALIEGKGKLDARAIVKNYGFWYKSDPFSVGRTTSNAMELADTQNPDPAAMRAAAQDKNMESLSNGSLMRATPLAVWCSNLRPS